MTKRTRNFSFIGLLLCALVSVLNIVGTHYITSVFTLQGAESPSPINQEAWRVQKHHTTDDQSHPLSSLKRVFMLNNGHGHSDESGHIFLDGIQKSDKLQLTLDVTDNNAHWFVDMNRCQHDCLKEALEKSGLADVENSTGTQLFLADYSDYGYSEDIVSSISQLAVAYFGVGNVHYATRQHMDGRNIKILGKAKNETFSEQGDLWIWEEGAKKIGLGGRIKAARYCVRSDTVKLIQATAAKENTSLVNRARPIDAASFWLPDQDLDSISDVKSELRASVSRTLLHLEQSDGLTVTAGLAGEREGKGRNGVTHAYTQALLDHKIITVAQRDRWEGHYRLMEALSGGALVMTDPMHPLPYLLEDGDGLVVYNSLEDLQNKILYYINNPTERLRIAARGYHIAMHYHRSWHVMDRMILGNWTADSIH